MNIYVGNLTRETISQDLQEMFEAFGQVDSAKIITDRYSGESRGFGFVEMPDQSAAEAAMAEWNGKDFKGRTLRINEARPRH